MIEWQPARTRPYHGCTRSTKEAEYAMTRVLRVRPCIPSVATITHYRRYGCDATVDQFYEIHPDDLPNSLKGQWIGLCIHEILTD